jgi:hypothetical protein
MLDQSDSLHQIRCDHVPRREISWKPLHRIWAWPRGGACYARHENLWLGRSGRPGGSIGGITGQPVSLPVRLLGCLDSRTTSRIGERSRTDCGSSCRLVLSRLLQSTLPPPSKTRPTSRRTTDVFSFAGESQLAGGGVVSSPARRCSA